MKRNPLIHYLFFIILTFSISVSANDAVYLSYGKSTSKDESNVYRAGYLADTRIKNDTLENWGATLLIDYSYSVWQNLYGPNIKVGSVIPTLHFPLNQQHCECFINFGIGLAYVNQTRWGNRKLGDNWVFEDKLLFGWHLTRAHTVTATLSHFSNAATNKNNDGTNIVSVTYQFRF